MEIAIIEDDVLFSSELSDHINDFFKTLMYRYSIEIINENFDLCITDNKYDIVFLDIELNEISGIDLGKKIKTIKPNTIIIFVSNRDDLVFDSLLVTPFYFVRKSCLKKDLVALFVLLKKYFKNNMRLITFDFYGRQTKLFLKDIYLIESNKHNVTLYTKNGEYTYRSTMYEILEKIGPGIVQFQKSYAVNFNFIQEINKGVIYLKNGEKYKIGRKFKDETLQSYKEYLIR